MSRYKQLQTSVPLWGLLLFSFVMMPVSFPALSGAGEVNRNANIEIDHGVVVEKVVPHSEGEKAGLKEGDIVLAWSRGDSKGEIRSPFDLKEIETEQSPLGAVKLNGFRGKEKRVWSLGPANWELATRFNFSGDLLSAYLAGQELAKTGKPSEIVKAAERWKHLARQYSSSQVPRLPVWLFLHTAEVLRSANQWTEADEAYEFAIQSAIGAGPVVEGQVLQAWAESYQQRSEAANAEKYFQQAITKNENTGGEKLAIAANLNALGKISLQRGDLGKAEQFYQHALKIQRKLAPESLVVALSLDGLGGEAYNRGNLPKAEKYFYRALDLRKKLSPESLIVAESLNNLGYVAVQQLDKKDLDKAEEYCHQSLEISKKLAPRGLEATRSLECLGLAASTQGDMVKSESYERRALEIEKTRAPQSEVIATILNSLGVSAREHGDLQKAEQFHQEALEIVERLGLENLAVANILRSLGTLAHYRGDLAKAKQYQLRALIIRQRLAPGSLYVSASLNNLGALAFRQGDLTRAEQYHRRALAINQKLAPGSLDVALNFTNLGYLARERGDLAKADQYHQQALQIRSKIAPESVVVAASLGDIALVAYQHGDLRKAQQSYLEALAIQEKLAPESIQTAVTAQGLGDVVRRSGDPAKAEQYYRRALAIREKLAPGSQEHAESLAAVASVLRGRQRLGDAAQFYAQAVSALESQTAHLGRSEEIRSAFRANHSGIYRDYFDLLLAQKQPDRAFEVLERSRARILLEMLLAAHIDIRKGADPSLLKEERSLQELLAAKKDRRLRLLGEKNNEKQIAAFTQEIEDLEKQYQEVEERLWFNSPAYAALTRPQALTASEIQQLLDPDTLLLEYSLTEERSYVFAVTKDSLTVHELPKRAEIESQATHLYELLTTRNRSVNGENAEDRQRHITKSDAEYWSAASSLSRILLAPLAADLGHKRLAIVADGALQFVPFAALPVPQKTNVALIAEHDIVELPSASVLAVLRRERQDRQQPPNQVVVVADPVFDAQDIRVQRVSREKRNATLTREAKTMQVSPVEASGSDSARQLTRSLADLDLSRDGSFHLPRLPFTRREATAIVTLTPTGMGRAAIDFDASRNLAISSELTRYRIVHFATHALVDNQHPELSGLVLSLVDENGHPQNGFLDLQDIYNLNLNADLVVLSACDTALGKQVDGEGMIGLTRGFMYAGASHVMGTLWKVEDFATAKFMKAFYEAMEQSHLSATQALRQAQLALWKEKHWSAPYYWAAFTLQGDWK